MPGPITEILTLPNFRSPAHPLLSLSWQTILFGIGIIGRQILLYLALPLFTRYLQQEDYGVVAVSTAVLSFADILSNAGLPAAVFRFYNDEELERDRRQILGSSFLLFLVFACAAAGLMIGFSEWVSTQLFKTPSYGIVIDLCAYVLVVNTIINFLVVLLRLRTRPMAVAVQGILQTAFQVGAALLMITRFQMGVAGYWWGQLIGSVLGLIVALWTVKALLGFDLSLMWIWRMLVYGFPLIAETMAFWVLRSVDRPILSNLVSLNQVAVYELGYKIGFIVCVIVLPFQVAWPQFAYAAMKKIGADKLYERVFYLVVSACVLLALFISVFGSDLVRLLATPAYTGAIQVVPWIAFGMVLWGGYPVVALGLMIAKQTKHIAWITASSAALNVVLNLYLVPRLGILGSAIAALFGYLWLDVITYSVARRFYPLRLNAGIVLKIAIGATLCLAVSGLVSGLQVASWLHFGLRLMSVALFPAVLYGVGGHTFVTRNWIV